MQRTITISLCEDTERVFRVSERMFKVTKRVFKDFELRYLNGSMIIDIYFGAIKPYL